jgi:hypothetical protein
LSELLVVKSSSTLTCRADRESVQHTQVYSRPEFRPQAEACTDSQIERERIMGSVALRLQSVSRLSATLLSLASILVLGAPPALGETLDLGFHGAQVTLPDGWSAAQVANFRQIYSVPATDQAGLDSEARKQIVQISVHTYQAADHAAAVQRLRELASGAQVTPHFLEIAGWPALQGRQLVLRPQPGADPVEEDEYVWKLTIAVAVADVVVSFDAWAPPDADSELLASIDAIASSLTESSAADSSQTGSEVLDLQSDPTRGLPLLPEPSELPKDDAGANARALADPDESAGAPAAGTTARVRVGGGRDSENEIAVSGTGQEIVIGTNNGFFVSSDGGATWGGSNGVGSNDPSVTWGPSGGPMGTFYAANINSPSTGIWTSTNGGNNFNGPTALYTCGQNGDPACGSTFPDQEHIVADRFNQTVGGDQVYSTWRHLDGNAGIVCSVDSGATWSPNGFFFPGDLPKIGIGQDGFVYVVYHPSGDDDIRLAKFTSCENNQNPMVRLFDVLVVSNPVAVACPTPGLDRCNFRNSLASPTVAVDDTDPNHIFIAYADNTFNTGASTGYWPACANQNLCNENIVMQDSVDGGNTWAPGNANRTVVISSGMTARRFMPWVCTAGGTAYVSWFDRRAASPGGTTVSNNSLTDIYMGSAYRNIVGNLTRGNEDQLNEIGSTDAQCESGAATGSAASWPSTVDAPGDSEGCSLQPQLGGRCCVAADIDGSGRCLTPSAASSAQICDFNQTVCPAGETCSAARGAPKYGDYNGAACAHGRFYTTWPSATSPPSMVPASTDIDTFFNVDLVCCEPEVQVPNAIDFGTVCADASATLDVCNTGAENMEVGFISSDNPAFAVTNPVGGFPVTISPDFCFPFEVTFDTGSGSQAGNLTVNTDDPINPALVVPVSGTVGESDLNVSIADSGDFGEVCKGDHADLDLTLFNQGQCDLTISDLDLLPDPDSFELPADLQLPLVLSHDADFNLPIRYSPEECFFGKAEKRTLRITSDDPDEMMLEIELAGKSPCPDIIIDPGTLSELHSFPTTVVDTTGTLGCYSEKTAALRNVGTCPATISSITAAAADFTVTAPTVLPILLPPGEETLDVTVRFTPQSDADPLAPSEVTGLLTVVSDDPNGPDQADLCGESSAQSGVRILVTEVSSGTPIPLEEVDALTISSHGINPRTNLRFTDHPVNIGAVCGNPVVWHVDQETLQAAGTSGNNPKGSYTAKAKEGNLQITETFGLDQCEMREFQLQLEDTGSDICLLLPKGDACTNAGECCSGKCKGPEGGKTCK